MILKNINLEIKRNKILGLIGASGSGKSTLAKIIVRLLKPDYGSVIYNNKNIFNISNKEFNNLRFDLQMVFQNPYLSLDNLYSIEKILTQTIKNLKLYNKREIKDIIDYFFNLIGVNRDIKTKHPSELSGGECQKIAIIRSLLVNPKFIIFDEATSALDIITQNQITSKIKMIKNKLGLTYLFISHNLKLIREISDEIAVIYYGKIVEINSTSNIFNNPKHPYTQKLITAFKKLYA